VPTFPPLWPFFFFFPSSFQLCPRCSFLVQFTFFPRAILISVGCASVSLYLIVLFFRTCWPPLIGLLFCFFLLSFLGIFPADHGVNGFFPAVIPLGPPPFFLCHIVPQRRYKVPPLPEKSAYDSSLPSLPSPHPLFFSLVPPPGQEPRVPCS